MKTKGLGNWRNITAASKSPQGDEVIDQKHVPATQPTPSGNFTCRKSNDANNGMSLILKDLAEQLPAHSSASFSRERKYYAKPRFSTAFQTNIQSHRENTSKHSKQTTKKRRETAKTTTQKMSDGFTRPTSLLTYLTNSSARRQQRNPMQQVKPISQAMS